MSLWHAPAFFHPDRREPPSLGQPVGDGPDGQRLANAHRQRRIRHRPRLRGLGALHEHRAASPWRTWCLRRLAPRSGSDPDGDEITHSWALIGQTGPPLMLPNGVGPTTIAQTLDDGVYTFELTVSDGELSGTDTTIVTVENLDPFMTLRGSDPSVGGVALVSAQFTDPGVIDTHLAIVDWGDGSTPDEITVTAQGTGWGSMFASHIYDAPGDFVVDVTLFDDDGGLDWQQIELSVGYSATIWANGTSDDAFA